MNKDSEEQENSLLQEQAAEEAENMAEGATEVKEQEEVSEPVKKTDEPYRSPLEFNLEKVQRVPFNSVIGTASYPDEGNDLHAVLGLEATKSGGGKYKPNDDVSRPVAEFQYPMPGKVVRLKRNGKNEKEGVTLTDSIFLDAFGKLVSSLNHREQINLLLTDNTLLVGYVVRPDNGRSRVYFPIHLWPKNVEPPVSGFTQGVRVQKLIIG
ncbi:MAG TPA: hypothetical protein VNY36_02990 [Bacteroidia bacterium]|jgi:hypothetical protein|nr:hypothetical protein [Bacteroidia bacterium]